MLGQYLLSPYYAPENVLSAGTVTKRERGGEGGVAGVTPGGCPCWSTDCTLGKDLGGTPGAHTDAGPGVCVDAIFYVSVRDVCVYGPVDTQKATGETGRGPCFLPSAQASGHGPRGLCVAFLYPSPFFNSDL